MPKTLPERIFFTIVMAAIMVYGMIVYNVALNKGGVGHAVCIQRHIVDDHAIDHDSGHDNGKEDAFR